MKLDIATQGRTVNAPDQTSGQEVILKRTGQLALWKVAWGLTLALARFGPELLWDSQPLSWGAITLNLGAGVGWIVAHARYLQGIDELQRKIMQDALAITLGVGWVVGFAYVVADSAGLVARDEVGLLPALMGIVYVIATVAGHIRYR